MKRWLFALMGLAALSAAPPTGTLHPVLRIKPGLWEFRDRTTVVGDTIMPDALLSHIPPAQRSQSITESRKSISQPSAERECMSQATFEQRMNLSESGCTRRIGANAASRLEVETECRTESGGTKQYRDGKIVVSTPVSVTVTNHAVTAEGNRTMTMDSVSTGHWVSANCGNVHGIQQLP